MGHSRPQTLRAPRRLPTPSRDGGAGAPPRPRRLVGADGAQHYGYPGDLRLVQSNRLGDAGFLPEGRAEQPPMPALDDVSIEQ
jgi:hypothetical protein